MVYAAGDTTPPNQCFTKDQLRVVQPGRLHSHVNLFGEHIKNPLPVILQTQLSHKQLGLQQGQTQQESRLELNILSCPLSFQLPEEQGKSGKKAHLKSWINLISNLGQKWAPVLPNSYKVTSQLIPMLISCLALLCFNLLVV